MIENKDQFLSATGLDADAVVSTLKRAADAAAAKSLPLFRTNLIVDNKNQLGFDPVTEADKTAEDAIRAVISAEYADHAIVGEERGSKKSDSDFAWIIDPIDGTRSFITGVPLWGTLIALTHKGRAIAGIASQPFIGEVFLAAAGSAVYERNGKSQPLRTSTVRELDQARIFTTTPALFDTLHHSRVWSAFEASTKLARFGTDCYGYCLLAAGQADLVIEPHLQIYDIAALVPIIEQAGGAIATWDGGPADKGGNIVAAASKELLDQALALIAAANR